MSPGLPLEELGATPGERRLLRRVGLVVAALLVGIGIGFASRAWPTAREVADVSARVVTVEAGLSSHLAEMSALRPQMMSYVREERAARCSTARNIYALCRQTGVVCEPVSASCEGVR